MNPDRFPIQDGPTVPWAYMLPHEAQCKINHGNGASIKHMAERGGFGAAEAWCVVNGLKFYDALPDQRAIDEARRKWFELAERVNREWNDSRVRAKMLSAIISLLTPLRERLDILLCDEDLTEEKLREASEGLLPNLADAIRFLHKLHPGTAPDEKGKGNVCTGY